MAGWQMSNAKTRIRTLRQAKGLSQLRMIQEMGYEKTKNAVTISSAENGEYVKPGFRQKLAAFFGVEESYLFNEEGFAK